MEVLQAETLMSFHQLQQAAAWTHRICILLGFKRLGVKEFCLTLLESGVRKEFILVDFVCMTACFYCFVW